MTLGMVERALHGSRGRKDAKGENREKVENGKRETSRNAGLHLAAQNGRRVEGVKGNGRRLIRTCAPKSQPIGNEPL
jgi:hypothetical protein